MIENAFVLDTFLESLGSFSVRIAKGKKKKGCFSFSLSMILHFSAVQMYLTPLCSCTFGFLRHRQQKKQLPLIVLKSIYGHS